MEERCADSLIIGDKMTIFNRSLFTCINCSCCIYGSSFWCFFLFFILSLLDRNFKYQTTSDCSRYMLKWCGLLPSLLCLYVCVHWLSNIFFSLVFVTFCRLKLDRRIERISIHIHERFLGYAMQYMHSEFGVMFRLKKCI